MKEPRLTRTKAKYQNIFGLYAQGLSPQEIQDKTGYSYPTIRRAVDYCRRRFDFDKPEQIEIAIGIKKRRLKDAHERLQEYREGWTEQKVEKTGNQIVKQTATKKFSHGSEVKLMSLIRELDNDLNMLQGLLDMKLKGKYNPTTGEFEAEATSGMTFLDCWKLHNPDKAEE